MGGASLTRSAVPTRPGPVTRRGGRPAAKVGAALALALLAPPAPGLAYEVAEVSNGGAVTGRVSFQGTAPAPKRFEVDKDPEVCGTERTLEQVAVNDAGGLRDVVVVLDGVERGKPFPERTFTGPPPGEGRFRYAAGDALSLDVRTKGCQFGPLTGVLAAGRPVHFANEDPVRHTLHTFVAFGPDAIILRTAHNQHIHAESEIVETFHEDDLRDSRVVRIICDRHDHMQNWFYVADTPYFAMTDRDGRFAIDRIPPGRYELLAWHPVAGHVRQAVQIAAGGRSSVELVLPAE